MRHDEHETDVNCMPDLGEDIKYLMSGEGTPKNAYVWSQCSQAQLGNFASSVK